MLWDARTGLPVHTFKRHKNAVTALSFSHAVGKLFAVASDLLGYLLHCRVMSLFPAMRMAWSSCGSCNQAKRCSRYSLHGHCYG